MAEMHPPTIVQVQQNPQIDPNGETIRPENTKAVTMALVQELHGNDAGFTRFFAGLSEALARRKVYRQTLRELKALSARELADLGIHRSMITRVAQEAAYGK
ncbi:DUF1127 domain-containing protein [Rhodobacter xanthinilyticus]